MQRLILFASCICILLLDDVRGDVCGDIRGNVHEDGRVDVVQPHLTR